MPMVRTEQSFQRAGTRERLPERAVAILALVGVEEVGEGEGEARLDLELRDSELELDVMLELESESEPELALVLELVLLKGDAMMLLTMMVTGWWWWRWGNYLRVYGRSGTMALCFELSR